MNMGTEEYFPCMKVNKRFILDSWNTFVDIFLHRVFMCGVQARLLSIITLNTMVLYLFKGVGHLQSKGGNKIIFCHFCIVGITLAVLKALGKILFIMYRLKPIRSPGLQGQ